MSIKLYKFLKINIFLKKSEYFDFFCIFYGFKVLKIAYYMVEFKKNINV